MTFPVLPLVSDLSELVHYEFITLSGQVLLDKLSTRDILSLIKNYPGFKHISVVYGNHIYSKSDVIELLNNGVSTFFLADSSAVTELLELGVPECRLTVAADGIYNYRYGISTCFSKDQIVPLKNNSADSYLKALLMHLKSDRQDGLYSTLVVDSNERCLGLVYSSQESIKLAIEKQAGVYYSRSRSEIWVKGATSGNTQKLLRIDIDCDGDALKFVVLQQPTLKGTSNFCHLERESCFGDFPQGLFGLEQLMKQRLVKAPSGSYTKRLFDDQELLHAKIKEEAEEVTDAHTKDELSWEVADLFYFVMAKMAANGVTLSDVEANLNMKHMKITKREGNAKDKFLPKKTEELLKGAEDRPIESSFVHLNVVSAKKIDELDIAIARPIQKSSDMLNLVKPIIDNVIQNGDKALLELTSKFDGVQLESPIIEAPFKEEYFKGLTDEVKAALDLSMENVRKFHAAQLQGGTLSVETQPGVVCSRFPKPIEKVGLYVPGGTATLPSTALMLGVPAQVAGCEEIVIASPPRKTDGRVSPEVVYVASKVGASKIVLAGGAQAVAAMAYGTQSVPKVDKILGPGNQFVTAAKMYVQNDTRAICSIDMPAGPSEVLVICDEHADANFVASDLLSQAEHGADSQVILIGINLNESKIKAIQAAVHCQALQLPRLEIIRKCISHSSIVLCDSVEEAFEISNKYAPEHLILQIESSAKYIPLVRHAGSVFVGSYTPESCGDYSSGTNHTLPTYGYARQYSGVNTSTFQKFITCQEITSEGLKNIGPAVMSVAKVEGLDAHRNAVKIRMSKLGLLPHGFD
ncbi:trifunctional histidinol dehydrogenase/phosphoribosyl-AMP cyclohydrolase/phosphoribosyl-ATP diphosphatase Ecym_1051 [Eremothecium cymbalariae DBVPG|uniref:Histidine biosynthesis trifunctional protein n=1 Tax=Eremothecium cymbalariae (strain CBS 270.75 / DBVPG 7215 / KCTC 17166 / NRRL Y-17582) TaxID=931890 RepID=G8JMA0_ERECY|nr:hypothetical protein Ecym_1051 [Eremothecium cymbalariae DBVPG\